MAAAFPDDVFVPVADRSALVETLCRHEERVVARDNTVAFDNKRLQLPESPLRHHWVGAKVRVHAYPDATLAIFHGPRLLARYDVGGRPRQSPPRAAATATRPAASRRAPAIGARAPGAESRPAPAPNRAGAHSPAPPS